MQFTVSSLVAVSTVLAGSLATPVATRANEPIIRSPFFHIYALAPPRAPFNGTVLTGYHTGAGTSYAVLTSDASQSRTAYLEGTEQQLQVKSGTLVFPTANFDTHLVLGNGENEPVQINVGEGSKGIFVSEDNTVTINKRPQVDFYGEWILLQLRFIVFMRNRDTIC